MHFSSNTNGKQTAPHLSLMYGAPSCKREVGKTNEERAAAISVLVCRDVPLYKTNCKQTVTSIPPTQPHHPSEVHQVQPKPLHCYPMISYKNIHTKVAEKTFVKISINTKQYIKHRQAMKVQKKQQRAAKKC